METKEAKVEITEEQLKLELEQGRELVRNGKYSEASEKLSTVLQKYVEKYGDMSVECADAWLREFPLFIIVCRHFFSASSFSFFGLQATALLFTANTSTTRSRRAGQMCSEKPCHRRFRLVQHLRLRQARKAPRMRL